MIEHDYEIESTKFSDVLTKNLEDGLRKQSASRRNHVNAREAFRESEIGKDPKDRWVHDSS